MSAVDEKDGLLNASETVSAAEVSKGYTGFREDDVLFAKITPCMENGKAAIARGLAGGIGFGSTEFHVLRAGPLVLPDYLFFYVRQEDFRRRAKLNFVGSGGHMRVPESFLAQCSIPLPPLSEQRRIVEILREAEAVRRHQAQAARTAAELVPALFHRMFGDPINAPRGAKKIPVESFVAEFEGGKSLSDEGASENSPFRILKISAITSGIFRAEESKPAPHNIDPASEHFVRRGDLLISRANTEALVGATAIVQDHHPNLLLPDKLWRFVFRDPSRQEPEFIYHLFQIPSVRKAISARASGTGGSMKNIGKGRLFAMQVALPPIEKQREFLALVSEIRRPQNSENLASELQASLLAHAFNGSLTARWRDQNAKLLAAEAAARDATLAAKGVKIVTVGAAARPDDEDQSSIYATPTDGAWADLTARQRALWRYIPPKGAFGVDDLLHARDKDRLLETLSEDGFRRELEVFVTRGALVHVSRPQINSENERDVFRHYYRKVPLPENEAWWNSASVKAITEQLRARLTLP